MDNPFFTTAFTTDILDLIQSNGGYEGNFPDLSQLISLPPDFSLPVSPQGGDSSPNSSDNSDEKEPEPKPKDRKMLGTP